MMEVVKIVVLVTYFTLLTILSIYGAHRLWMLLLYYRHKNEVPQPQGDANYLPVVTVQLAVFNEMNVIERLMDYVVKMDWPKEKLEIQVLDDSTDDTVKVASAVVDRYKALGFDIQYLHRTDRTGYKAGALDAGLKASRGEFVAIFDADFIPPADFLRRTVPYFNQPRIAVVQARWGHLNQA